MRYCSNCVLPDTRPHLSLDTGGVCIACRRHAQRADIDWGSRADSFRSLTDSVKALRRDYDCVIPVSGGKDSTWQTIKCLEFGLKPLAVTWRSPGRTTVGQRNLENLVRLGVDHLDYSIDPDVERRFMKKTFVTAGSTAIPMHLAIFAIPTKIAVALNVPLVVWGENSAVEYGGREEDARSALLDAGWVHRYGVTQGTTAADWVGEDLSASELSAYASPSESALEQSGVRAVFLGHFFAWDPAETSRVASEHGFEGDPAGPRTGIYDFADIDDCFISTHHWLKWFKFGFTRTFDNLSLEIRNRRVTRAQAVDFIARQGDETPWGDLGLLGDYLSMTRGELIRTASSFRSLEVWERGADGIWRIPGFLVPEWDWRAEHEALYVE